MRQFIIDHFSNFGGDSPEASLLFDSDLQADLSAIFAGLVAEIGIAEIIVVLLE